jgi:hypothetical protein
MPQQTIRTYHKPGLDADFSSEIKGYVSAGWLVKSFNTNIVTILGAQGIQTHYTMVLTVLFEKP